MIIKIVLIGADGQLGFDLKRVLGEEELIPLIHQDIEITDKENCFTVLNKISPQIVINTAGYIKVDECEKNPEKSYLVNSIGALNVAQASFKCKAACVYISTDYIFDGEKNSPYLEEDWPHPLNIYGMSKFFGEMLVKIFPKYFIVRSCGLYGVKGSKKGYNFVDRIMELGKEKGEVKVVSDQALTPTYTLDLALAISELIKTDFYGIYHITNTGCCSWYDFTKKIFDLAKI
ncbi:MAG: dTDP-4-dehydrorhamnose reductase, partial [Armatimonadetes bacterium]|nr:dTDP-4-dehydrorhamnose reductase [Armatimonadota bacterium]